MTFDAESEPISLPFNGVRMPTATIYDFLGWILSITARPAGPAPPNPRNYYLPLLAMLGRWCQIVSPPPKKNIPGMVSIAWFPAKTEIKVLMGSAIGDIPTNIGRVTGQDRKQRDIVEYINSRALNVSRARVEWLQRAGLTPADPAQLPNPDGDEGRKGFGKCAETFFWIYAKE